MVKVVLFVGGRGTRLFGGEAPLPKALFEIGGRPIIWHILQMFMAADMRDFLLLLGYRGDMVADYFINHAPFSDVDVKVTSSGAGKAQAQIAADDRRHWQAILCPTGVDTEKGERLRVARQHLQDEPHFLATYGDGLSDIDLQALVDFHLSHGKMATVTAVRVHSQWGHLHLGEGARVLDVREKPPLDAWINAGFFVFKNEVLDFLEPGDTLEGNCLPRLARAGELMSYRHEGFWSAMDTYKDNLALNEMWDTGAAPWHTWDW